MEAHGDFRSEVGMTQTVRDLFWKDSVFRNSLIRNFIFFGICIFGLKPIGFESFFVTLLVPAMILYKILKAIKSLKRRPAPEFLKLSDEVVHSIHTLVNGRDLRLNKRQCLDMSSKLSRTIHNIRKLLSVRGSSNSLFRSSLEHLYQVLLKAKVLVNDCSNENWIGASVFQMQNESAFQVILMDVGFCYHAIYQQAKLSMSGEWKNVEMEDLRDSSTFKPASVKDVDEDREELREMLENLLDERNYGSGWLFQVYYFLLVRFSKRLRLAEYLLVKLHCIAHQPLSDGLRLSERLLWEEESYSTMTWGREFPLGVGAGASGVCKTEWLNIPCAKKCNIPELYFFEEAGILSHVNHPNVIKYICCGEKLKSGGYFIVLELMEMSLSDLIKKKEKEGDPFSYAVAVDIMTQIGRGMCYLHGLRVAHRDLKPANVVLDVLTSLHLEDFYHVKLVDFGTSKTQVEPSKTTSTENGFGTLTHKAPEVRHLAPAKSEGDRKWRAVWFKADVWSFAVVCLEVLSLKLRKSRDDEDEDLKSMIPRDCPHALVALLEDCLQADPRARPDFFEVCSRLEALRHGLLRRLPTLDQDSLSELSVDCSHNQFREMRLKEHLQRQTAGVVANDDEMQVLLFQALEIAKLENQETFRLEALRHRLLQGLEDSLSEISLDCSHNQFIEVVLKEHFYRQNGGVVVDDKEVEVLIPQASHINERANQETFRTDQFPDYITVGDRDLEIRTKKRRNDVVRKAVEQTMEKFITKKIHMYEDQQVALSEGGSLRISFLDSLILLMLLIIYDIRYQRMPYPWVAHCTLVLLEALYHACWVIYEYRRSWRLFKAAHSEFNMYKVLGIRIIMLSQKSEFNSFEDDAKECDLSSYRPPKLTWLLLNCVKEVFMGLLLSICLILILSELY